MSVSTDEINRLIRERRSVKPRNYNGVSVDDAIVHRMLENARWAPTHGMTEPWKFIVFSGEGRNRFATFTSELYRQTTPGEKFLETKFQKLLTTPMLASHLISICMIRQMIGKIPESEEMCAVACAVQNMQLTATAYGIGSYWSTGAMTYHEKMKEFLGIGSQDKCLGLLYIGNYDVQIPVPPRTAIAEKSRWITA